LVSLGNKNRRGDVKRLAIVLVASIVIIAGTVPSFSAPKEGEDLFSSLRPERYALLSQPEGVCTKNPKTDMQRLRLAQRWEKEEKAKQAQKKGKKIEGTMPDPFKPINRGLFAVNDRFYFWGLKPVAQVYKIILPERARLCVRNAISNLHTPIRFVDSVLQLKMRKAGIVLSRFVVNSTIGVAGLFDPAATFMRLEKQDEDAGQTLGVYGLKEVAYIDWPVIRPSCARDSLGLVADTLIDPLYYLLNGWLYAGLYALDKLNETSLTLGTYEDLKASAIDPYISVRNAYYQYRRKLIQE